MKEFPTYFTSEHALSMTLRDYFAAKAMPLAYQFWSKDYYELNPEEEDIKTGFFKDMTLIAETSYEMADAMLKARNEKL